MNSVHSWLVAPHRAGQRAALEAAGAIVIDAHRNLRGPYTAAAALIGEFIDRFGESARAAALTRLTTLLAIRPELAASLPVPAEVAQSMHFTREGNRTSWSLRCAHEIVEFLLECLWPAEKPMAVGFHSVDQGDPLDIEFLTILLRRADPARLQIMIAGGSKLPPTLTELLPARVEVAANVTSPLSVSFIDGDCTDDDPAVVAAYKALDEEARRASHRRRAEQLEARGEASLHLGAIPLHRERAGDDATPLAAAARACIHFAYYDAALDWGERACTLALSLGDDQSYRSALRDRIFSLLLLDRWDEGEVLCDRCLAESSDPEMRVHAGYAKAILAIRLRPARDVASARGHIEAALAAAAAIADSETRVAKRAFLTNTLALIVTREGRTGVALALMGQAIEILERGAPARFAREGMILFQNRARLHLHAGREEPALADLGRLLELEPGNAEALFDRALIHQRAGRADEALRDYDAALFWAPPQVETLLNRATLRWQCGAVAETGADVARGLQLEPRDARLLCLRGLLALGRGELDEAEADFAAAIAGDPAVADGWANRAIVHWRRGRLDDALADIDRALTLGDNPAIQRNRARVIGALARQREEIPADHSFVAAGEVPVAGDSNR